MRLIDADNFKVDGSKEARKNTWVLFGLIEEQPTIDAIPIEWIKKQIEKWKNWDPEGLSDDEWEYGTCLETLLEDWEKENERLC